MALFQKKEKCERCGEKFRSERDDQSVCESCKQEMELLIAAAKESSRSCPIDGAKMDKTIAHMIVIDRCPTCQGVWLDGGELKKLYKNASQDALVEMTHDLWIPMG